MVVGFPAFAKIADGGKEEELQLVKAA